MTYALPPFALHRPATVEEAAALAAAHPGALFLAGGTDLMVNLRRRMAEPEHVIHLGALEELRGIALTNDELVIGAMSTLAEISASEAVRGRFPMLAEAAGLAAGPTLRVMGTLGGNICLDTRCRYYNQSHFWRKANDYCLKKDGTVCHVAPGGHFCWAAFSGDTPPALLALDATLELLGPEGPRTVPIRQFYGTDGRWSIGDKPGGTLPGELLLRVRIPLAGADMSGAYEKVRVRDSIDYPLAGAALLLGRTNGPGSSVTAAHLALTGVYPAPVHLDATEALSGAPFDMGAVETLQKLANKAAKPMRTTVVDPAYRRSLVGALVEKLAARLEPGLAEKIDSKLKWG